ncbi:hypothetical protein MAJHIDBO_01724 [Propionibacterium freudenreichii subsp. shermanii]|nr:hypothetical protein MAJHIDBO_01724 [Propionibacterium freudenreichii subsp. shermanii]SPS09513.1 hypothetical protein MAJHIDBO_01724 [Propionibacterium freudenreichii subsp. shermanii]
MLDRHHGIHQAEPLEGILRIAHLPGEVALQVVLDEGAGQGGTAEHHGEVLAHPESVELGEVVLHHHRRLHQQATHPDGVGVVLLRRLDDGADRLLDAQVHHGVAVVGHDDVDQVLADVVDIALDGGEHQGALPRLVSGIHVGFQVRDCPLHRLGGLQDERELHLARPEELPDGLHALEQVGIEDVECPAGAQGLVEVVGESVGVAVDDALAQPFVQWQRGEFGGVLGAHIGRRDAGEHVEHPGQRVVVGGAAIVDQVQGDLSLFGIDAFHRHDLGGPHDRRVQSCLDRLVQEHRVEYDAGGRVQPEGDIGHAQGGAGPWMAALELGDGVERLQSVAAGLLLAGGDREGEAVDEDVSLVHAPGAHELIDQSLGDGDLAFGGAGLALLVDRQGDHGGAVLGDDRHQAGKPGSGLVPVLEVD